MIILEIEQTPNWTSSWSTMINIASANGTNTQTFTPTQPYVRVKFLSGNAYSLADMSLVSVDVDTSYSLIARGGYRYGFQGQERDDEVAGVGNSYTAEFWQYDSRLGRRWNLDPVLKEFESPYAAFSNNPICFADPNGADTFNVVSQTLNSKGETWKEGDERLSLFTVYTDDSQKEDMSSSEFLKKYQMLAKNLTSTVNGSSNTRKFAEFISANSDQDLLKKAVFVTTVQKLNQFTSRGLAAVGGKGGGLSNYEKWTLFNHGEEYDFKEMVAKGYKLTYVDGVGMFETDHLGNMVYGSVASRAGQGLKESLYDGDWLTEGPNTDSPYDSYSLMLGHFFGSKGITKPMLKANNTEFVKVSIIYPLKYGADKQRREAHYRVTISGLNYKYSIATYD